MSEQTELCTRISRHKTILLIYLDVTTSSDPDKQTCGRRTAASVWLLGGVRRASQHTAAHKRHLATASLAAVIVLMSERRSHLGTPKWYDETTLYLSGSLLPMKQAGDDWLTRVENCEGFRTLCFVLMAVPAATANSALREKPCRTRATP